MRQRATSQQGGEDQAGPGSAPALPNSLEPTPQFLLEKLIEVSAALQVTKAAARELALRVDALEEAQARRERRQGGALGKYLRAKQARDKALPAARQLLRCREGAGRETAALQALVALADCSAVAEALLLEWAGFSEKDAGQPAEPDE